MFTTFLFNVIGNQSFVFWLMIFVWITVFTITLFIEFNTADITTIWFCVSALVSFFLALFDVNYLLQIIIFSVLSILLVYITRPLTKKIMNKTLIRTNADKIITQIGVVTKEISDDEIGEVKVNNELWRAVSVDSSNINVGEKVSIVSFNGNKVVVSKIKNNIEKL